VKTLLVHLDHSTKSKRMQVPSPLGLLKLYSYRKRLGDDVRITSCKITPKDFTPDEICFSPLFLFNAEKDIGYIRAFQNRFKKAKIKIGGVMATMRPELFKEHIPEAEIFTGLQPEFDDETPCYEAMGMDFSFGFTSRGCVRKCPWCVVPKIEGKIYTNEKWKNALAPGHKHFIAIDNNVLACGPEWMEEVLSEMSERNMTVDFNQALDCRLFVKDEGFIKVFKKYKKHMPIIRFAWDSKASSKAALETLKMMKSHKYSGEGRWYMLYGFKDTPEEIWNRIKTITDYGHKVKPMIYRDLTTGKAPTGWYSHAKKLFTLRAGPVDIINCFDFQRGLFGKDFEEFMNLMKFVGRNHAKVKKYIGKDLADEHDFKRIRELANSGKW